MHPDFVPIIHDLGKFAEASGCFDEVVEQWVDIPIGERKGEL